MATITNLTLMILLISLVTGCATNTKEDLLPQNGPTMLEIYRMHQNKVVADKSEQASSKPVRQSRNIGTGDADLYAYTRDTQNEIEVVFPRLANPTLVMYIYPHLSTESRLAVPGYSTSFPMYDKPEYALPGEKTR